LFSANEGYLDDVEISKVVSFEAALHAYMAAHQADLVAKVNAEADWNDELEAAFHEALKDFKANHSW
jgi:F-type H+-transporting ATPase subunit alpha